MSIRISLSILFGLGLTLSACLEGQSDTGGLGDDDGDAGGSLPGGDDGGGEDTGDDDEPEGITAGIQGSVTVQLYTTGNDGEREYISYEDAYGGEYPFGKIFVGSYQVDGAGRNIYVGTDVVSSPTTAANPYSMDLSMDEDGSVYVYASVDWYQDSVVGSHEPRGVWPAEIPVVDGDAITGIDITVLAPLYSGSGGDGTGGCGTVDITGEAIITVSYSGGDVATMLLNTGNSGPYHVDYPAMEPSAGGSGASGDYELTSCQSYGEMKLVGAWDENGNGMFEPTDRWGSYLLDEETDGNPITVEDADMPGYDVTIPFGDAAGINIVPFVRVSGQVAVDGGAFDDLPEGSTVHVAALKYRPNSEFNITESDQIYDSVAYEWADLTGEASKEYDLVVPANSVVYLWAYADMDNDGLVNESGEYVASGGSDGNGRVETGGSNSSGNDLSLGSAGS